jgi:hypothetical protein
MIPARRERGQAMFLKVEGGQHFVSDSRDGPWTRREILESRQPKEKPIMGKSGFDRALEEKEKGRRRLREAQDMPLDLTDAELDELLAEFRQFAVRGRGEDGKLSRRAAVDHFASLLDAAHAEPTEEDELLAESFGVRSPRRCRRGPGQISNERFIEELNRGWY